MPKGVRNSRSKNVNTTRELQFKDVDQEYAVVVKALGDCRLECRMPTGETKIAHIRGAMKNKARIYTGDLVLISEREFETGKVDVIGVYSKEDVKRLRKVDEISEGFVTGTATDVEDVEFDELESI